jgi:hypothetical protein
MIFAYNTMHSSVVWHPVIIHRIFYAIYYHRISRVYHILRIADCPKCDFIKTHKIGAKNSHFASQPCILVAWISPTGKTVISPNLGVWKKYYQKCIHWIMYYQCMQCGDNFVKSTTNIWLTGLCTTNWYDFLSMFR